MSMPNFARLQRQLSPAEIEFYEFLWTHFLQHKTWPSTWHVYRTYREKPKLAAMLNRTSHSLYFEDTATNPRAFGLQFAGIMATSKGKEYQRWLVAFLEYLRERFYAGEDGQSLVTQAEVQKALKLSAEQSGEMGQVIRDGFMSMHPSWQPGSPGWQLLLPCHVLEDFPRHGSLRSELDAFLDRSFSHLKRRRQKQHPPLALNAATSLAEIAFGDNPQGDSRRYQVFVSSPFIDLKDERKVVVQALLEIGCFPAGMELFPAASMEQWKLIKNVIAESDYYVVFTAAKYGSLIPHTTTSYTEREFEYARKIGKPILAFYHSNPGKISGENTEHTATGKRRLEKFVERLKTNRLCRSWSNAHELADAVKSSLLQAFKTHPATGWVRAS